MAKAYSSFFFHLPPHSPPPPSTPPPLPTRPQTSEPSSLSRAPFRSFLSLDADSVRSFDADSIYTATTVYSQSSFSSSPRTRPVPAALDTHLVAPSRASSHSSRSSLRDRALPRPKPVPRATLPDVPASAPPTHTRYPRTAPAPSPSPRPRTSPASQKSRKPVNAPPRPAPPRFHRTPATPRTPDAPATAHPHHLAAPPHPKYRLRPASIASVSSTVSTQHKVTNRIDALARLEGRHLATQREDLTPPPFTAHPAPQQHSRRLHSPPLPQYSPPPYSPMAAQHRVKSAAPVLATRSFMPFSDEDSDDESDGDRSIASLGLRLSAGLHLASDSEDEAQVGLVSVGLGEKQGQEKRGRRARRTTIASWYVGPEPAPKNFMDFGDVDVDVDVDVYDLDMDMWKGRI